MSRPLSVDMRRDLWSWLLVMESDVKDGYKPEPHETRVLLAMASAGLRSCTEAQSAIWWDQVSR